MEQKLKEKQMRKNEKRKRRSKIFPKQRCVPKNFLEHLQGCTQIFFPERDAYKYTSQIPNLKIATLPASGRSGGVVMRTMVMAMMR